jgi:molybdopterin biosynthesis enzyme
MGLPRNPVVSGARGCACLGGARSPSPYRYAGGRGLHLSEESRTARVCPNKIRRGADGALEALKFPREGARLLSSLIETEGLVELPESATLVEPGAMVAFLPYLVLL